ncbi:hypothetical protein O9992_23855 [Vibrio lentus]|nr:hypothetical protein [Vibrio lentus]
MAVTPVEAQQQRGDGQWRIGSLPRSPDELWKRGYSNDDLARSTAATRCEFFAQLSENVDPDEFKKSMQNA